MTWYVPSAGSGATSSGRCHACAVAGTDAPAGAVARVVVGGGAGGAPAGAALPHAIARRDTTTIAAAGERFIACTLLPKGPLEVNQRCAQPMAAGSPRPRGRGPHLLGKSSQ